MVVRSLALTLALTLIGQFSGNIAEAIAQPDPNWIRVMIIDGEAAVELRVDGPVRLVDLSSHRVVGEFPRFAQQQVRSDIQGIFLDNRVIASKRLQLIALRDASIYLNGTQLRGSLEIIAGSPQKLRIVNHVALEDYLRGVLSKEAPDYWPKEALKAIAIAARTYAAHRRFLKTSDDYDVTSSVMSQEYGGKDSEKHATDQAVLATAGRIVLYKQKLFPTFYHSTCGEVTENGRIMGSDYDIAPLRGGVVCFGEASPFFQWKRRFTPEDVNWVLHKGQFGKVGAVEGIRVDSRTQYQRVKSITIIGTNRELSLKGYDFRALFGFDKIRSLDFTVTKSGRDFIINGRGWGHGVGMCQWGAAELARRGYSAEQILSHYYPEIQFETLGFLVQNTVSVIGGS